MQLKKLNTLNKSIRVALTVFAGTFVMASPVIGIAAENAPLNTPVNTTETKFFSVTFDTTYTFSSIETVNGTSSPADNFKYEGACTAQLSVVVSPTEVSIRTDGEIPCTDKKNQKVSDASDFISLDQTFIRGVEDPSILYIPFGPNLIELIDVGSYDGTKLRINMQQIQSDEDFKQDLTTKLETDLSVTPATFSSSFLAVDTEKMGDRELVSTTTIESVGTLEPTVPSEESALP